MKRYKLLRDLPTFSAGSIFTLEEDGCLYLDEACAHDDTRHWAPHIMAYHRKTLERFPILRDWFEDVTPRDAKTKEAFKRYLDAHEDERFFQAVRNFAQFYLGDEFNFIYASKGPLDYYVQHYEKMGDTFFLECDEKLRDGKDS